MGALLVLGAQCRRSQTAGRPIRQKLQYWSLLQAGVQIGTGLQAPTAVSQYCSAPQAGVQPRARIGVPPEAGFREHSPA